MRIFVFVHLAFNEFLRFVVTKRREFPVIVHPLLAGGERLFEKYA